MLKPWRFFKRKNYMAKERYREVLLFYRTEEVVTKVLEQRSKNEKTRKTCIVYDNENSC